MSVKLEPETKLTKKENTVQAVKFLLFSCSAGVIEAGSFSLLNELARFPYWPAYLIALILSVLYNFTLNRHFTFQSATNISRAMLKVFGYYCVFTPVSTILGDWCVEQAGFNEYIVLFVTMVSNLITEFLFCRFVVYRNSINTSERALRQSQKRSSYSI